MTLRPDERANEALIERSQAKNKAGKTVLKTAVGLGASALTAGFGAGIAGRILPFLSEHIPTDLAIKGISKVSPKLGGMLQKGMQSGLDLKEGLDYLKEKLSPQQQQNPSQNRNIIEQYSPELHQFLTEQINQGRSPLEAGALAEVSKKFQKEIKKLVTDHKTPFSALLETVYGGTQQEKPQQNQQGGPGQQALMAMLQKLQQIRGGGQGGP